MMWAPYYGNDGAIVAFLAMMREHGITVEDALAAHESELAEMMQDMVAAGESATVAQYTGNIDAHLLPGEEVMGKCPDCGATVAGKALCPAKEPPFRCRMACTSEDCSWWGKSTRTPAELRKAGTLADVEEQHRGRKDNGRRLTDMAANHVILSEAKGLPFAAGDTSATPQNDGNVGE